MNQWMGSVVTQAYKVPSRVYTSVASADLSLSGIYAKARCALGLVATYGSISMKLLLRPFLIVADVSHLFYIVYCYKSSRLEGLNPEVEDKIRENLGGLIRQNLSFDQLSVGTNALFKTLEDRLIQKLLESTLQHAPSHVLAQITLDQVEVLFKGQIETCIKEVMSTASLQFLSSEKILMQGLNSLLPQAPPLLQDLASELLSYETKEFKLLFLTRQVRDGYNLYLLSSKKQSLVATGDEHRQQVYEFKALSLAQLEGLQTHMSCLRGEDLANRLISFDHIKEYLAAYFSKEPKVHEIAETHLFSLLHHETDIGLLKQVLSLCIFDKKYEETESFLFSLSLAELMAKVIQKKDQLTAHECAQLMSQVHQHRLGFHKLAASTHKLQLNQIMNELTALLKAKMALIIRLEQLTPSPVEDLPIIPCALWPMFEYLFDAWGTDSLFLDKISEGVERSLGKNYSGLLKAAQQEYLASRGPQLTQDPSYSLYQKAFAVSLCFGVYVVVAQLLALSIPLFIPVCGAMTYYLNTQLVGQGAAAFFTLGLAKLIPEEYRKIYDQTLKEVLFYFIPYVMELFYRYGLSASSKEDLTGFIVYIDAYSYRSLYTDERNQFQALPSPSPLPEPLGQMEAGVRTSLEEFEQQVYLTPQANPLEEGFAAIDERSTLSVISQQRVPKSLQEAFLGGDSLKTWLALLESYPKLFEFFKDKREVACEVLKLFSERHSLTHDQGVAPTQITQFFELSCLTPLPPAPSLIERLQKTSLASGFGQLFSSQILTQIKQAIIQTLPSVQVEPVSASVPTSDVLRHPVQLGPILEPLVLFQDPGALALSLEPLQHLLKVEKRAFFAEKGFTLPIKADYSGREVYHKMVGASACALIGNELVPHQWLKFPTQPSVRTFETIFADLESLDRVFPYFEVGESLDEYLSYIDSVKGLASQLAQLNVKALSYRNFYGTAVEIAQVLQKSEDLIIKALSKVDLYEKGAVHPRFLSTLSEEQIESIMRKNKEIIQILTCMELENFYFWQELTSLSIMDAVFQDRYHDIDAFLRAWMVSGVSFSEQMSNTNFVKEDDEQLANLSTQEFSFDKKEALKAVVAISLQQEPTSHPIMSGNVITGRIFRRKLSGPSLLIASLYLGVAEHLANKGAFLVGLTQATLASYFKTHIETLLSPELKHQKDQLIAFCQQARIEPHGILRGIYDVMPRWVGSEIIGYKDREIESYLRSHIKTADELRAFDLIISLGEEKGRELLREDVYTMIQPSYLKEDDKDFLKTREIFLPKLLSHLHQAFMLACIESSQERSCSASVKVMDSASLKVMEQDMPRWDVKPAYWWLPEQIHHRSAIFFGFNKAARVKQAYPQLWNQIDRHFFEESTVKFKNPFGALNQAVWHTKVLEIMHSLPCPLATFVALLERQFVNRSNLDVGSRIILSDLDQAKTLLQDLQSSQRVLAVLTKAQRDYLVSLDFNYLVEWVCYQSFLLHGDQVSCFKPSKITFCQGGNSGAYDTMLAKWFGVDPASLSFFQLEEALCDVAMNYSKRTRFIKDMRLSRKPDYIRFSDDLIENTIDRFTPYLKQRIKDSPEFLQKLMPRICSAKFPKQMIQFQGVYRVDDVSSFPLIKLRVPQLDHPELLRLETVNLEDVMSSIGFDDLQFQSRAKEWIKEQLGLETEKGVDLITDACCYLSLYELYVEARGSGMVIFKKIEGQRWIFQKVLGQGSDGYLFVREGTQELKLFDKSLKHVRLDFNLGPQGISHLAILPHAPHLFIKVEKTKFPHQDLIGSFAVSADSSFYQPVTEPKALLIQLKARASKREIVSFAVDGDGLKCVQASGMSLSSNQTVKTARVLGPYLVFEGHGQKKVLYQPLPLDVVLGYRFMQSTLDSLNISPATLLTLWPDLDEQLRSGVAKTAPLYSLMPIDTKGCLMPSSFIDFQQCLATSLLSDPISFKRYTEGFCQKINLEGTSNGALDFVLKLLIVQVVKGHPLSSPSILKLLTAVMDAQVQNKSLLIQKGLAIVLGMILYHNCLRFKLNDHAHFTEIDEMMWLRCSFQGVSQMSSLMEMQKILNYMLAQCSEAFISALIEPEIAERLAFFEQNYPSPDSHRLSWLYKLALSKFFRPASTSSASSQFYIPLASERKSLYGFLGTKAAQITYRLGLCLLRDKFMGSAAFDYSCLGNGRFHIPPLPLLLTLSAMTPEVVYHNFCEYINVLTGLRDASKKAELEVILDSIKVPQDKRMAPLYILQVIYRKRASYGQNLQNVAFLREQYEVEYAKAFPYWFWDRAFLREQVRLNTQALKEQCQGSRLAIHIAQTVAGEIAIPARALSWISSVVPAIAATAHSAATTIFTGARRCGREHGGRYQFMPFLVNEHACLQVQMTSYFSRYFEVRHEPRLVDVVESNDEIYRARVSDSLRAYQAQLVPVYTLKMGADQAVLAQDIKVFAKVLAGQIDELEVLILKMSRKGNRSIAIEELINILLESDYKEVLAGRLNLTSSPVELMVPRLIHLMLLRSYLVKFTKAQSSFMEKEPIGVVAQILEQPKYYLEGIGEQMNSNQERFIIGCLAIEAKMGIELRELQAKQLQKALVENARAKNVVIEMIPGSGKTDFGMVLNAFFEWEKGRIPIAVFAGELIESMKANYAKRFRDFCGRHAYFLSVSRAETADSLSVMYRQFEKSSETGDVIITTKESLQALNLLYVEIWQIGRDTKASRQEKEKAASLLPYLTRINHMIKTSGCFKVDECHELLRPDVSEKFPYGEEENPNYVDVLAQTHVMQQFLRLLGDLRLDQISSVEYKERMQRLLAEAIAVKVGLDVTDYLSSMSYEKPVFLKGHPQEAYLAMCRGAITTLIPHALNEKLNVTYGLSHKNDHLYVIPYNGNLSPDEESIFGLSDITLMLSYFYYLSQGLTQKQFSELQGYFESSIKKEMEESRCEAHMSAVQLFLMQTLGRYDYSFERDHAHPQLVLAYMSFCVAPTIKRYHTSFESTSSDFASMAQSGVYYSGTIYNSSVYPQAVHCRTLETTGETLHTVKTAMLSQGGQIVALEKLESPAEQRIDFLTKALSDPNCSMIIDAAHIFAGIENETIARQIFDLVKERGILGVQFFDRLGAFKVITGSGEPLLDHELKLPEDRRISYLGDRFFGVNIAQGVGKCAAVTLGSCNLSTFEQAAWRMRGLSTKAQYINVYLSPEATDPASLVRLESLDFEGILKYLVAYEKAELLPLNVQARFQKLHAMVRSFVMDKVLQKGLESLLEEFEFLFVQTAADNALDLYGEKISDVDTAVILKAHLDSLLAKVEASSFEVSEKAELINLLQSLPHEQYPATVRSSGSQLKPLLGARQRVKQTAKQAIKQVAIAQQVQKVALKVPKRLGVGYAHSEYTPWPENFDLDTLGMIYFPDLNPEVKGPMPCANLIKLCRKTGRDAWIEFSDLLDLSMSVTTNALHFYKPPSSGFFGGVSSMLGLDQIDYRGWQKPISHVLFIYHVKTAQTQTLGLSQADAAVWTQVLATKENRGPLEYALYDAQGIGCKMSLHHGAIELKIGSEEYNEFFVRWKFFNFDSYFTPKESVCVMRLLAGYKLGMSEELKMASLREVGATRYQAPDEAMSVMSFKGPGIYGMATHAFCSRHQNVLDLM